MGVYYKLCGLNANVTWIKGNHDNLLSDYISLYYETPEKSRSKLPLYRYNSFDIMRERLTEVDLLDISGKIKQLPLQVEIEVGSRKYLLSHGYYA